MPKVTDLKAYFREIATKAGLTAEQQQQAEALLAHDGFSKAFGEGFKPLPDYSHDLDSVRERTERDAKAAKDAEYADWFAKEKAKYDEFVSVVDEYKLLKAGANGNGNGNANANGGTPMTQAEIDKLVETKLSLMLESTLARRDAAYLSFRDADYDHQRRFGKPVDRVAFEKSWKEHPEWGGDLFSAYSRFIEPEVEKAREADVEKRIKAAREEGIRDGYTRRATPADVQSNTFSPIFDAKEDIAKMSDLEQERHSRKAFLEGLVEAVKT